MQNQRASLVGATSEESRALLQIRVALFWKVMFFISLLSCGVGAVGAIVKPGTESLQYLWTLAGIHAPVQDVPHLLPP